VQPVPTEKGEASMEEKDVKDWIARRDGLIDKAHEKLFRDSIGVHVMGLLVRGADLSLGSLCEALQSTVKNQAGNHEAELAEYALKRILEVTGGSSGS
jgi:hypothetical protein